jgi:hypothetical protein
VHAELLWKAIYEREKKLIWKTKKYKIVLGRGEISYDDERGR